MNRVRQQHHVLSLLSVLQAPRLEAASTLVRHLVNSQEASFDSSSGSHAPAEARLDRPYKASQLDEALSSQCSPLVVGLLLSLTFMNVKVRRK